MVNRSRIRASHAAAGRNLAVRCLAAWAVLALGGCDSGQATAPIDWWHDLQGGAIAQARPPAPGVEDPYPRISSVPPPPTPTNPQSRTDILRDLTGSRSEAEDLADRFPLAAPVTAGAIAPVPGLAAQAGTAGATLAAASAPPAPAAAQPPMPPLLAAPPAGQPPAGGSAADESADADAAVLASLPASPPPRPVIGDLVEPAKPSALLPHPAPQPNGEGPPTEIAFAADSSVLTAEAARPLHALAARRHGSVIAITGHGDVTDPAPVAQRAALSLALARAQAVAAALAGEGVPLAALRIDATPAGRGAAARLVD